MPSLTSWYWHFLENHIYRIPQPPPRQRPANKPLQVICVGLPRSGTESLQHALLTLGYTHTYHGWDILFDQPYYAQEWAKLGRKKFFAQNGDCETSAAEFDALLGHSVAVTDTASSVFASEMIRAFPEAKAVLNVRRDLDAWHASAVKNLLGGAEMWVFWFFPWWNRELFWAYHAYHRILFPGLFRCVGGSFDVGIRRNGKWVYREHCAMIRGLVPKERLLEWSVEDGWEPLCEFLGKEVPGEKFPRTNDAAGFEGRKNKMMQMWFGGALLNIAKAVAIVGIIGGLLWGWRTGKLWP
ncbi:hypothetical protein PMZ80_004088 [Knufia obscura]|uniref:NAD dependent epimerase/dehydratase n=1 Tax=Knufia obscura TaxID=1635080 RepID=A0ABR0RS62_9EURO|nr:hypothetical protein PMZ80_004088 [Knufia obscura]